MSQNWPLKKHSFTRQSVDSEHDDNESDVWNLDDLITNHDFAARYGTESKILDEETW